MSEQGRRQCSRGIAAMVSVMIVVTASSPAVGAGPALLDAKDYLDVSTADCGFQHAIGEAMTPLYG